MEHVSVNSSNISSVGHEGDTMEVLYKHGTPYRFSPIDKDTFNDILNAPSVGKAIHALGIKGIKIELKKKES